MIIDSHVHLYSKENALDLSWMTPDSNFNGDHNLSDYMNNTVDSVDGLVFIEVDVKNDDLSIPVKEYSYVVDQYENDTHGLKFKKIIAYCPLLIEPNLFKQYIVDLQESKGLNLFSKYMSGFRFLLQDKPMGTMSNENLINNLKYLGLNKFKFDLGIDLHSSGLWQFDEFINLLKNFNNENCPIFILNHLTKPNLTISPINIEKNELFINWSQKMKIIHDYLSITLSKESFVKLSGSFSELSKDIVLSKDINLIKSYIKPWLSKIIDIWGKDYLIWGSDFPVLQFQFYNNNTKTNKTEIIPFWKKICDDLLINDFKFNSIQIDNFYYQNTIKAYTII